MKMRVEEAKMRRWEKRLTIAFHGFEKPQLQIVQVYRKMGTVISQIRTRLSVHKALSLFHVGFVARRATQRATGFVTGDKRATNASQQLPARLFPDHPTPEQDNEWLKRITVRHLLEMRSGFDADEDRPESVGHEDKLAAARDWLQFALQVPVTCAPGSAWAYASLNAMLLGRIVETASSGDLQAVIVVVDNLEMVIVITSAAYGLGRGQQRSHIIIREVIQAVDWGESAQAGGAP
jgi:hypothetical protein